MRSQLEEYAELGSFRIVSLDGIYYAVPKSDWSIRPADLLGSSNSVILSNSNLTELIDTVSNYKAPLFSIIIPTRSRPALLRQALDSLKTTTDHPGSIEIILVIDSDDPEMIGFSYPDLPLKIVTVPPGTTMGGLNMAGFDAAKGDYIFLLNDDVIARTSGWDTMIAETLKSFPDGVVTINVNDKLFHDSLSTFPILSRSLCEMMGGVCPQEYIRYRIDDHIHNIFNLLALLGHRRIVYMEEVVFEHLNRQTNAQGIAAYIPNETIHARDTSFFDAQLPERKALAVRLAARIDDFARQNLAGIRNNKLLAVTDSVAIRHPQYSRRSQASTVLSSHNTRVTIGVVSADIRSDHTRKCLDQIKQHTHNFDLIVLDNNRGPNFNHAREMNRVLAVANTEFVVLMDDDVFVEPGWLDEMLKAVNPSVGLVTPAHKNLSGDFVYGGVVMRPDQTGHHTHIFSRSRQPRRVQTVCSAIYLLDLTKCGHLRVDEQYTKYFLDIEFGLKVWEAGFQVICNTSAAVTHVGGGTLKQGSDLSGILFEEQRQKFVRAWIDTARYWKLESVAWRTIPEIAPLVEHPGLVGRLLESALREAQSEFDKRIEGYCAVFGAYPALLQFAENAAGEVLAAGTGPDLYRENLRRLIAASQQRRAKNPDVSSARTGGIGDTPWRPPMEEIPLGFIVNSQKPNRERVLSNGGLKNSRPNHSLPESPFFREAEASPELKKHRGYSISRFEHKYFGIRERDGEFSYDQFKKGAYAESVVGHSMAEVLTAIDRAVEGSPTHLPPLVFLPSEAQSSIGMIQQTVGRSAVYLVGKEDVGVHAQPTIHANAPTLNEWAGNLVYSGKALDPRLGRDSFGEVVLPWTYPESMRSNLFETVAGKIADRIRVVHSSGAMRVYDGENLHRLTYNKAYLASMMEHVRSIEGLKVLEVGCSDGLVCDLMVLMGAEAVVGIDVMESAGCSFPHGKIEYRAESATHTSLDDEQFDLSLSIATLEHVPDPYAVMEEMLRVTKVGGICYVQAGPLYHSPFGHHMFSYFPDYPWIHLRKSKEEIIDYVMHNGIARTIERDLAKTAEQYISGMLNFDHINGLFLEQYRLNEFRQRDDVEILKCNISYEGKDLLTPQILTETRHLKPETLTEHGFEIQFRRVK